MLTPFIQDTYLGHSFFLDTKAKAKLGDLDAQIKLGKDYFFDLKAKAELGDLGAQAQLGKAYFVGLNVLKNQEIAEFWLREAQKDSSPIRSWVRGFCHLHELADHQKDARVAREYFFLGHVQHCPDAQASLGLCYLHGEGGAPDYEKAVHFLGLAAARKHAEAMFNLAMCCFKGIGCEPDIPLGRGFLRSAVKLHYAEAQYIEGICHLEGLYGVKPSRCAAAHLFRLAAEQGYAPAQLKLGMCYHLGWGVEPNLESAANWYWRAAEGGEEVAQKFLRYIIAGQGGEEVARKLLWMIATEEGEKSARKLLEIIVAERGEKSAQKLLEIMVAERGKESAQKFLEYIPPSSHEELG